MLSFIKQLLRADWFPAVLGALAVWVATASLAGQGLVGTLAQGVVVASFLALVGFGELLVITLGRGNIDLSVPYVLTLSAYVGSRIMDGADTMLLPAIMASLAIGATVGIVNFAVIRALSVPPLIGTLAVGFVLRTVVELVAESGAKAPSPILTAFATQRIGGIAILAIFVVAVGVLVHVFLMQSRFGRQAIAAGQSAEAARLAGIFVWRIDAVAYVLCGLAAALCGLLLAAYSNGPSLDMAGQYQLGAIAVVVLGGTAIGGGRSNVVGVWWAALLLTMLSTLMSVTSAGPGVQRIVEGLVIVGVLAVVQQKGQMR